MAGALRLPPRTRDYLVRMPRDVTVRSACEDVECDAWRYGWDSLIDESTPLGAQQAEYIRTRARRTFTEIDCALEVAAYVAAVCRCSEHHWHPIVFLRSRKDDCVIGPSDDLRTHGAK